METGRYDGMAIPDVKEVEARIRELAGKAGDPGAGPR
jgi:hypothetical protein